MTKTLRNLFVCVCALPLYAHAQLNNGGLYALFGVDADTRANWMKYGSPTGAVISDDWFAPSGTGANVIDTTGAASYRAILQTGANISFNQRMAALLYAKVNGKLWLDAVYGRDYEAASSLKDSTTFTNAAKNGGNPNTWTGGVTNTPDKNDLVDIYAHMRRDGVDVHDSLWLFTGVSTYGTTGSSYFDVELYKNAFSYNAATGVFSSAGPDAGHTQWLFDAAGNITQTGDMIIAVNYSPGSAPVVDVRIWVARTVPGTVTPAYFKFTGSFNGASILATFGYASIVSKSGTTAWGAGISNYSASAAQDTTYATPWGTGAPTGSADWSPTYLSQQFMEVGLNLSRIGVDPAIYSTLSPCQALFSNIFFKSRSSNSFTSNMQDFMTPLVFTRNPVLDFGVTPDTLRCNHTTGLVSLTDTTTAAYYSWTAPSGGISGSNGDSSSVVVSQPGTYIVSASPAAGCPATRVDTVVVPIDTVPPVATASAAVYGSQLQLFGGAAGLSYQWTGPDAFASSLQNPATDTIWGRYGLTVASPRNGCTDTASVLTSDAMLVVLLTNNLSLSGAFSEGVVALHWVDMHPAVSYTVERMAPDGGFVSLGTVYTLFFTDGHPLPGNNSYRVRAVSPSGEVYYSPVVTVLAVVQRLYVAGDALLAQTSADAKGVLVVYDVSGRTVLRRPVSLTRGANTLALPAATGTSVQVVTLYIDGARVFSQKVLR
ncbi:MAG TPA: hypothetical protein VL547_07250 [Dinghuibacter sp.]|uniref:hypothetical protein n=1 Tax=Dinghuibacter sp. TaxID=2024697 RepID=UPI002D0C7F22|nr:hypothetical protein [Dinghuibacter sp.]HTJ11803.1 hypothetical protein [Dinghuibacter sp.]